MSEGQSFRLVVVESPYAGDVATNLRYARACVADCLRRGEAPFASHLLYTQDGILDDTVREQRALGIEAGLAWGRAAHVVAVYVDLGVSPGMALGILRAKARRTPVEYRSLAASRWRGSVE